VNIKYFLYKFLNCILLCIVIDQIKATHNTRDEMRNGICITELGETTDVAQQYQELKIRVY